MSIAKTQHNEGDFFIITTPNQEWSGKVYGLTFVDGRALLDTSEVELARELEEQFTYEVQLPVGFTAWENAPDASTLVSTRREYRVDEPKKQLMVQGRKRAAAKTEEPIEPDA